MGCCLKIEECFYLSYRRVHNTIELLKKYVCGKTLDIGSGRGINIERISSLNPQIVIGLDIVMDEEEIKNKLNNKNRFFIQGDCTSLPFPNNSFDFIFAHHVIEHIDDFGKALDELYRVVNEKGRIILCVPTLSTKSFYFYYFPGIIAMFLFKKIKIQKSHENDFKLVGKHRPAYVLGREAISSLNTLETLLGKIKSLYLREFVYCWSVTLYFAIQNNIEHKIKMLNKKWKQVFLSKGLDIEQEVLCGILPCFISNFIPTRYYPILSNIEDNLNSSHILKDYVSQEIFYVLKK